MSQFYVYLLIVRYHLLDVIIFPSWLGVVATGYLYGLSARWKRPCMVLLDTVLGIRMFWGLSDPHQELLVTSTDPEPSFIKQNYVVRNLDFFVTFFEE